MEDRLPPASVEDRFRRALKLDTTPFETVSPVVEPPLAPPRLAVSVPRPVTATLLDPVNWNVLLALVYATARLLVLKLKAPRLIEPPATVAETPVRFTPELLIFT